MVESVKILGVRVDGYRVDELHVAIAQIVDRKERAPVLNVNAHALNLAYENPWLRDFFNSAPIIFCDGAGVGLAARLLGKKLPKRITYADWMWQLSKFAQEKGYSLFFLGAQPGVAQSSAHRLLQRFPGLVIAGVRDGYFDRAIGSIENQNVVEKINSVQPNILVLGMGMPIQERWILENLDQLKVNVVLTGGAVFDYISGETRRAPRWMTDHGLEWLGRLLIEPRRLWRRYVLGNPLFLARVLRQRFTRGE